MTPEPNDRDAKVGLALIAVVVIIGFISLQVLALVTQ